MVSVISSLATAAVVISFADPCSGTFYPQSVGQYYKPLDASGFTNTTAFWRRGPCPALPSTRSPTPATLNATDKTSRNHP
ncbi:hypothetical protein Plhal304r1_c038g0114401 [Plasmopara halstedii]